MTKLKRFGLAAGAVLALGLVAVTALHVSAQISTTDADKQALRQIKVAYEDAVNRDDMTALAPHLASNFSAVMATGQKVNSLADFEAYWKTMKAQVGIGPKLTGKYTASLEPLDSIFLGGYAFSFGTSKETLVTDVPGPKGRESRNYAFNSNWYAVSTKDNGVWKLVAGRVVVDPFHTTFSEAKLQEIASAAAPAMKAAGLTQ
jgi:ketosteroid isomerase-like protein